MAEYERHEPEKTLLHEVVREQLEGFLASSRYRDQATPRFVEQELRAFLRCGVLAHSFLRLHCDDCGHDRLVAFSCKRRGFCPSCGGRRMADTAAHLVDRVLPEVPIRQWVLTLPYRLRYRCAYDAKLTSEVLRAFMRALFAELRRRARNQWDPRPEQCGAVTFIQRFGSALNLNVHFHTLALDGVYTYTLVHGGAPRFLPLPPPGVDEVARVLAGTARRIQRLVEARAEDDPEALTRDEPLVALLTAASLRTRIATGAHRGEPWRRLGDRVEPREGESSEADPEASARVPHLGGMSLHADVAVLARDRRRLERLCRYGARPPLASERLEERSDGTLALRLKSRWRDGTTHILMERSELIERLVPLIPPPRAHQVRYHGILAPGASQRDRVLPDAAGKASTKSAVGWLGRCVPPPTAIAPGAATKAADLSKGSPGCSARFENLQDAGEPGHRKEEPFPHSDPHDRARRMRWAALLQRVFEVAGQLRWPSACESKIHRDALRCPRCGSTLRLIAAIEDPMVVRRILECLELPARAPPLAPAVADARDLEPGLDQDDGLFDQSPAHDEPDFLISGS